MTALSEPTAHASPDVKTLVVISHVVHYRHEGLLYAYGPYAREIDEVWAELFCKIVIVSPMRTAVPPSDGLPFTRSNVSVVPQIETDGCTIGAQIRQLLLLPVLVLNLIKTMARADAIHVRCPGNLGLLGALLAPLFSTNRIAKYAGQWNGYPGEPWTVRLQRTILKSSWWGAPVTVYGEWPNQPAHVIPFFTSILTEDHISRARSAAAEPRKSPPYRILSVGRLSKAKNVDVLLQACARLRHSGVPLECDVLGEGPEAESLTTLAANLGLGDAIHFHGGVPFDAVLGFYETADLLVLPSETEGWPKVLTEAMAFGVPCVASHNGLIPWMLGDGRGLTVPVRDVPALAAAMKAILQDDVGREARRQRTAEWAQRFTLEGLQRALCELMARWWNVSFQTPAAATPPTTRAECTAGISPEIVGSHSDIRCSCENA